MLIEAAIKGLVTPGKTLLTLRPQWKTDYNSRHGNR
jgi:hypothetical protein